MKALLILGLALLLAAGVWWTGRRTAGPNAAFADKLYQRGLLNATGRAELLRRMRKDSLRVWDTDSLFSEQVTQISSNGPAGILAFCTEAFEREFQYRTYNEEMLQDLVATDDSADVPAGRPRGQLARRYAAALKRFHHDTAAAQRWYLQQLPARLRLEEAVPAEDSVGQLGCTIYPPLSAQPAMNHWIGERRSVFGKTRTRTARDLFELGLIENPVYEELRRQLQLGQRRNTYTRDKAVQLRWLGRLRQAGLLSGARHAQLVRAYRPYELYQPFDLLTYCERGRIFDLRRLPRQPMALYPALFAQLPALLPGFRYTDLRVTTRTDGQDPAVLTQNVTIRFRANGRQYEDTFLQDFIRKDGTSPPSLGAEVGEHFTRSLNQWLADQNSALRLYRAYTPDAQSVYGNERLGLIAMTQPQRELWGPASYLLSKESHDNRFSSAHIDQLIAGYQHLGLLSHLSAAELARGRAKALLGHKTSFAAVLLSFPDVIHPIDWESALSPAPYAERTRALAAISRGGFAPTQIKDGFNPDLPEKATFPYGFRLGAQTYATRLKMSSDWLDTGFVDIIKRALREQHAPGQFYDCLDGEGYIFLTPEQYQTLHKTQPELFETSPDVDEE
ncbi:hypothetical protein [Hymenobacter properus]|uniref:Uncharacterized protein n=1 Tax=Hymenobacter properus TaxID=2791026 RepID=A0A931BHA0_9BACT|nr:hypothetical protein [Hymenobacter properus]MBF9142262.1 hypothetical protein [Hymenobacter properus]MBR7721069.1 hypothetical protein [Microvirga sp. SRT04]